MARCNQLTALQEAATSLLLSGFIVNNTSATGELPVSQTLSRNCHINEKAEKNGGEALNVNIIPEPKVVKAHG